jgi:hypothetical protein
LLRFACALAVAVATLAGAPAAAQQRGADSEAEGPPAPEHLTEQDMVDAARTRLRTVRDRKPCPVGKPGEIVVCAQDPEDFSVPSDVDTGVDTSDGMPRAPDLFGIQPGGVVIARGCFIGPCPRKMPPIIDLKAIPEAPPGSDAARWKEGYEAGEAASAK